MQRLLISVRGPKEALAAIKGGAHIADAEYPSSALGTPYPLNINAIRNRLNRMGYGKIPVSTNIGEKQFNRASACQAALGVATAGADIVKCGLAELSFQDAAYIGDSLVRTVKKFYPRKKVIPAVFVDDELVERFDPFRDGVKLINEINADGLLIDTFDKSRGKGLLDYCKVSDISKFVKQCHASRIEAWIAGSITMDELPGLWATGVDVICIRGAACEQGTSGRFGEVKERIVRQLMTTLKKTNK